MDLRYNMIDVIQPPQTGSPWGIMADACEEWLIGARARLDAARQADGGHGVILDDRAHVAAGDQQRAEHVGRKTRLTEHVFDRERASMGPRR